MKDTRQLCNLNKYNLEAPKIQKYQKVEITRKIINLVIFHI
jgi:hypothetical protein